MKHLLIGAAMAATIATGVTAQEVSLGRFFGACEDAGTDTKASVGEACIIQSIINAASAEIDGVTVNTLPTDWGNFYDQIKASYAGGTPPDIHVMHRHRIHKSLAFAHQFLRAVWIVPEVRIFHPRVEFFQSMRDGVPI